MWRMGIAFIDGYVESPIYPVKTEGRDLFTEFGRPHFWHGTGSPGRANMSAFIKELKVPAPGGRRSGGHSISITAYTRAVQTPSLRSNVYVMESPALLRSLKVNTFVPVMKQPVAVSWPSS